MPYVVTQSCCSDASCVFACPVNCIHPTPDEPDFGIAEMLYIDPDACVECGACVSACPVDAIVPHSKLPAEQQQFLTINADFYRTPRDRPTLAPVTLAPSIMPGREPLRVAIVGSGPAAMYAADELLVSPGVQVDVFDRLPTPYGLVRSGVAPDHPKTKQVTDLFEHISAKSGFRYFLNVEVGSHVSHEELLSAHHAVIYAVGASADRRLGIPGDDLAGCVSATDFVAWYNGHPDHAHRSFDLSGSRVVIVGNGNVALDVARILTTDPDELAATDIAAHALAALHESRVREVVLVARRGPAQSAFTVPEFVGLMACPGIEIVVDAPDGVLQEVDIEHAEHSVAQKLRLLRTLPAASNTSTDKRRIVLRYLSTPSAVTGDGRVEGIVLARNRLIADSDGSPQVEPTGETEVLATDVVLTSIGYRGVPLPGLPFDEVRAVVPNTAGRVVDDGVPVSGAFVAGWIKRGPSGFIGTNKSCSLETVNTLVDDFNEGLLAAPGISPADFARLVLARQPEIVDRARWQLIDREELVRGVDQSRVRDKFTDRAAMLAVTSARSRRRFI